MTFGIFRVVWVIVGHYSGTMVPDSRYIEVLADIDDKALSPALVQLKHDGKAANLSAQDEAFVARLLLHRKTKTAIPTRPIAPSEPGREYLLRAEMIAAGKTRTENDRKGLALYKKLLEDIDRKNGCKCGYGSKLRGVKMQVAHFLKNLEA